MNERRFSEEELESLLGAYALDAVAGDERAAVEEYLAYSPRARAEVGDHQEVAALLGFTGASAPEGLWDRIARDIEDEVPPALRLVPMSPDADVVDLAAVRRRRLGRGALIVSAAAAAAAIVTMAVQIDHLNDKVKPRADLEAAAAGAMVDDEARIASLVSDDGAYRVDVALQTNGDGYLVARGLPTLPDDQTYQLWGVVEGKAISLGVLGAQPRVAAFHAEGPIAAVALTIEVRGGVQVSEQDPVAVVEI